VKILVTGGDGFLGRHLCKELAAHKHTVVPIDRTLNPEHDLRLVGVADAIVRGHRPDLVVHLAAKVGRLFGEDDPMETVIDNVGMTALVAQACQAYGARLAYASTSEIYGDNGDAVCDEQDGPFTLPHNLYGISKGHGEHVCEHYAPDGLTIFRFSMPYGPGLPAGRGRAAIINMLHQALHMKPIPVHKGAERSWCWVGDTVRAARVALEDEVGGVFNVGRDDAAVPMLDVAKIACDLTDAPYSLIEEVEAPGNQTVVKRLATDRIRALGWEPMVELDDGMGRTLDWVRSLTADGEPVPV